jgi:threonine/homoserine/homoserine lactone efflux protein
MPANAAQVATAEEERIVLSQAIGNLLPLAVGVALSPVPIIAIILMLGTPKARSNGPAFALGWIVGLVAVSVIVLVVAGGADKPDSGASNSSDTIKLLLGVAFLFMAMRQWRSRPKKGEAPTMPKWMNAIDKFDPVRSFGLGALLSGVNPKNLALTLAAAASIAQAGLSTSDSAIAVAVFVVLGSVTVVGPVIFFMFGGEHATKPLASIKEFMAEHNAVIMMVILLVLGAKLIGDGWSGLGS